MTFDENLLRAIKNKGFLKELGSNKYYRRWCFLDEPKLSFDEWVYKEIKEEYEKVRISEIQRQREHI